MRSCFELSNGVQMPKIGFGTYKSTDGSDECVISQALEAGYRLLDTAAAYKNEEQVGKAITRSGISRKEIFLTSKVWKTNLGYENTKKSFQESLETVSLLKELGAKTVVARADRDVQEKFLLRNGADHVVYPEKQVAKWAAIRYTADHIFDYIEIDEQHAIFEVEVPQGWIGKSVGELNIRRKYGINILGIKHSGKTDVSITPDTVLSGEITILALGEYKALQKCFRI